MTGKLFNNIAITGLSIVSPLGENLQQVGAATRANVKAISEHPYYHWKGCPDDVVGDAHVQICPVPTIDLDIDGQERISTLTLLAMSHLLDDDAFRQEWCSVSGLHLALPQNDEVISTWPYNNAYLTKLVERADLNDFATQSYNQLGTAGVFYPINKIAESLISHQTEYFVVGGIDSYVLKERMELADKNWRLKTPRNLDGFTPGEAAVLLVLETVEHAKSRGANILATIDAIGFGHEPNDFSSAKHSTASGLTEAIRSIMDVKALNEKSHIFDYVYTSLNGESYYHGEWALVMSRLGKQFDESKLIAHHASSCGTLGAATGAMQIALATDAIRQGRQSSSEALLWVAAENAQRMALSLSADALQAY